jgi:hypothetical protein
VTAACIHCNNTGSLSKDLAGHLDCAHCTVANERAELEKWAKENRVSYVTETDLWLIFQHGRGAALANLSYEVDNYNGDWTDVNKEGYGIARPGDRRIIVIVDDES